MKIYVINLDKATARLAEMEKKLSKLGLEFIRVAAETETLKNIIYKAKYPWMRCVTNSEFACNSSHAKAWKMIAEDEDEYAVILEDDAIISDLAADFLRESRWIKNTDLIKLDIGVKKKLLANPQKVMDHCLYDLISSDYTAVSYIISKKLAKELYPRLLQSEILVDAFLFNQEDGMAKKIKPKQIYPAIVKHPVIFESMIEHPRKESKVLDKIKLALQRLRVNFHIGKICKLPGYRWGYIPFS